MNSSGKCAQCGTILFREAAAGLCPRCLGTFGFGSLTASSLQKHLTDQSPLLRLGDYDLLEEIARGGMGVVYKSLQRSLNRVVAVKVVLHGPFSSPDFEKRFQTETNAIAGLRHPNIVTIYEVGESDGTRFFSMEFIEGKSLADVVREKPLPAHYAAEYLKKISEAVHYAHQHGVVHRDLKPSNLLLDSMDQPRVTDFGLAKLLDSEAELTTTGQVLGSPGYISPERSVGQSENNDIQGDIYSLGAVLYHLVTGRPPFQGENLAEILHQVQNSDPIPPRRLIPSVPRDLETICLKCLQKSPRQRYQTALELAQDLERFLEDKPIRARPVGWIGQSLRWCRRRPALAISLGICSLLVLLIGIGSPIATVRINRERIAAEKARENESAQRHRAEAAEHEAQSQLYSALLEQARSTVLSDEMGHQKRALDALQRAASISNNSELRKEAIIALALPDLEVLGHLAFGDSNTLRSLDPSFERIALCRNAGPIEIRTVADQSLITVLPAATNLPVYDATQWSPDGKYLAVKRDHDGAGSIGDWEIWDVTRRQRLLWLHDISWNAFSFHHKDPKVIAGKIDGSIAVWDLNSGTMTNLFSLPSKLLFLQWSPVNEHIAAVTAAEDGNLVSIFDAESRLKICSHSFAGEIPTVSWHPSGNWLAVPGHSSAVFTMNAHSGECQLAGHHKAEADTAIFSADGQYFFTGGWEGEIICWESRTLHRVLAIDRHAEIIKASQDGRRYAILTSDGIEIYQFKSPGYSRCFNEELGERLLKAEFSPDSKWLAATAANSLGIWNTTSKTPAALVAVANASHPTFSSDGIEICASRIMGDEKTAFRWRILTNLPDGAPQLRELPLPLPEKFTFLSLHSNEVMFTTEFGSQSINKNRLGTEQIHWQLQPTESGMNKVSPDGRWLAINAPWSKIVYIYRASDLQPISKLNHIANVSDFTFSPDSEQLALSSPQGIQFWNTSNWKLTRTLKDFSGIRYGPGTDRVWLMRDFRTAGLYDANTLKLLLPLPDGAFPLAVSPDGSQLAVSLDLRRLELWDLTKLRENFQKLGMDWD
jgi:eukaryotic-like serine/threonine-protein kinase